MAELALDGVLETFQTMDDFESVVSRLNEAIRHGWHFANLELDDGSTIGFALPNVTYVKSDA